MWDADINMTVSYAILGSESGSITDDGSDIFYGLGTSIDLSGNNSLALNIDYT